MKFSAFEPPIKPSRLQASAPHAIALIAGIANGFSFAPQPSAVLQTAALATLFGVLARARSTFAAGVSGALFGMGSFAVGVHWLYISLHDFGEMPGWLASGAVAGLCAYLSIFPAVASAVWRRTAPRDSTVLRIAAFGALWAASEWLRGFVFTGFPWIAVGYAHVDAPLVGFAPIGGMVLVNALVGTSAAALAFVVAPTPSRTAIRIVSGVLLVASLAMGLGLRAIEWTTPGGQPISVRLVQGNVAQDVKFRADALDAQMALYERLVTTQRADLIVLPETAMPTFAQSAPRAWFERIAEFARATDSNVIFGVPIVQLGAAGNPEYFNSAQAITPSGGWPPLGHGAPRYDKHHLVPFGEFIPLGFRWFVDAMHMPLGDFTRGAAVQPAMVIAGQSIAIDICYEDLFGELIAGPIRASSGGVPATILINLSNIAWFGDSAALPQHLLAARMRAIETGRPMLRATNTGMTAAIGPTGVVQASLKPFVEGTLATQVQGMRGQTPYVQFGDGPWLLAIVVVVALVFVRGRDRRIRSSRA